MTINTKYNFCYQISSLKKCFWTQKCIFLSPSFKEREDHIRIATNATTDTAYENISTNAP